MAKINTDDTIVAISTPVGEGGIGIVRMSGNTALSIADEIFYSKDGKTPSQFRTYTTHYGHIMDSRASQRTTHDTRRKTQFIDEVILTVMRAPKSYTKEDIVEVNCHGGIVPMRKVLELVLALGARLAEPGEFTKRAFLNGRIDLMQAEAVLDIIRAKTDAGLKAALNQLEGGLTEEIKKIKNDIMDFYIHIEAAIDFPEEDISVFNRSQLSEKIGSVHEKIKILLATSGSGKILRDGIRTVICGRPNAGKSTLMNTLLKEKRVIVTPIPGTTRDVIEEIINIDGIPLKIADTAGIIEPLNLIDKESAEKTHAYINAADLVLLILDNSLEFNGEDTAAMKMVEGKKVIVVVNKTDLPDRLNLDKIKGGLNGKRVVRISAGKCTNIDKLEKAISEAVWGGEVLSGHEAIVTRARHIDALERARKSAERAKESFDNGLSLEFVAVDIKGALDALGEIAGETLAEDILDGIFGEFCIGK